MVMGQQRARKWVCIKDSLNWARNALNRAIRCTRCALNEAWVEEKMPQMRQETNGNSKCISFVAHLII